MADKCTHLGQIRRVNPKTKGCKEYPQIGDG
jgi:hypothetical protein